MEEVIEDDIDGSIKSIHVRNFFCHENLEINLNRNVNFIVGRNGSGKSAILSALVVGLGSRASATNRGTNLSSFIKKGANSATIEIKIKNNSLKAYKHDIYGDYITIVRNINASGGSNYKIKSATGEVISTKLEEVSSIILAHDIQVDNPISVLTQEGVHTFHKLNEEKIYSLFRKATNLDQTEANYVKALENCNRAISIWNRKNESCAELEREYEKWKKSHEQMQSRDEIEAQKQALQNEYYWSEIAELEREAASAEAQHQKQNAKCEKLLATLRTLEERYGGDNSNIEALKAQLEEKTARRTALERELQQLEDEARGLRSTWRGEQHAAARLRDQLAREQRKVADLQREIENIQCGDAAAARRRQAEAAAEKARRGAATARARYDTARHEAEQARANAAHAHQPADAADARVQRQRDSLKQLRQQLRELESRGDDSLAVYGAHMVELCQRVRQAAAAGQFSAPPRGPVGHYLKLKEKKWGGAIEGIIGGSLKTFCVNKPEDSRKLFEIMGKVYGRSAKPGVTCSPFQGRAHDVRRHRVRANGHACALDALQVTDPEVANFLIDNVGLEKILLVPDHEDAVRLADTEENVPERCAKIVTLDGSEYYPAPNYRSYGGARREPRLLHLSTADRRRQIGAEIQEAEASLAALEAEAASLAQEARAARERERSAAAALRALLAALHEREEAARRADAALDAHHAPQQAAVLVEELNLSKEKVRALSEKMEAYDAKERQFQADVQSCEAKLGEIGPDLTQCATECRNLNEEIEREQMKVDQGVSERRSCQLRAAEEKSKLAQLEATLKEKRAVVAKKIEEALTLCPRVENPRSKAAVTSELKKTQLKLSSIRSDGLSRAEVAERLLAVERKFRRTKLALDRLRALIDDIKLTTDKHLKFCHKVQTYIARRVQYCFQSILTLREYSGRLEIDQAAGRLKIVCTGRESAEARRAASTSSLSGGERSYSTVAFIMALWECVELPFYFMDEFDLFMDNVNRTVVIELLKDHALRNTSRQFVFLTPHDVSAVSASPQISIHLMADPRP
ncbi:unnamed protein product, partial [Iphiclides podalirius]